MKTTSLLWKYALGIYVGLVVYFVFMKIFNFEQYTELRLFNFFIMLIGLYLLLRANYERSGGAYFENLFLSFKTISLSILLACVSLFIYLTWIDPDFLNTLESTMIWGKGLSKLQITIAIGIEGISSGLILSFTLMQYMKKVYTQKSAPLL